MMDALLGSIPIPDDPIARLILYAALDGKDQDHGGGPAFMEGITVGLSIARRYPELALTLEAEMWHPPTIEMAADVPDAQRATLAIGEFAATGDRAALRAAVDAS